MHTRILSTVLVTAAIICLLGAGVAHAELKIGFIRSDYIFDNYEPYDEATKQLNTLQEEYYAELTQMRTDLEEKVQEASQKSMLMTDETRRMKQEELQKQEQDFQARYEELFGEEGVIMNKQDELLRPIIDRINESMTRIAEVEDYDFIFDATTAAGSPILWAAERHDMSDQIIEDLNKGGGAE
jgi:outer membrane protein